MRNVKYFEKLTIPIIVYEGFCRFGCFLGGFCVLTGCFEVPGDFGVSVDFFEKLLGHKYAKIFSF